MPDSGEEQLRALVETQLRGLGYAEPPVSVDGVAEHMGVPVRSYPMPPWFTAALIYEDGMPSVLMNASKTPEIRRSALGHLLGHMMMLLGGLAEGYPRDTKPTHGEADFISTELKMPGYLVRDQAQKWFNDYRYLAGLFGVEEGEMFDRMRDLGIIKSRGVVWDY